jgi:hypothetical protein
MLKIEYLKQTVCFLLLLMVFSCQKDIGNYDYQEINAVDFAGIEKSYSTLLGEKFKITPVLKFSKDENNDDSRYTFEWVGINTGNVLPGDRQKLLAKTRNLDVVMQIPPGSYKVYYNVTDNQTGVRYSTSFMMKVETSIYEGWMVLNDVNGVARLDMVSKINNVFTPIVDVLASTGSELVLKGKPVNVYCYAYKSSDYGIYVSTDQATNRVDPETFKWKNTFNLSYEMVANVPQNFHADFFAAIKSMGANAYMYAAGNVYYYFNVFQINYSTPINLVKGETAPFRAAPFLAAAIDPSNYNARAVMFDVDKKRFLNHGNNESNSFTFSASTLFDFNNVGMDLVYMEYSEYNSGDVFAVLRNPAGKIFLARFNAFTGLQTYFSEILGTDIANGQYFAVSPVFGYLFYSSGGKLYEYDTSLKTSKLMLDKGAEKISLLKFPDLGSVYNKPDYAKKKIQLIVASYNPALPADKNGKMETFDVPSLNGNLVPVDQYTGFGKIISIDYRTR